MIIIGLGSNLPGPGGATPRRNLEAALENLAARGMDIIVRSSWYQTEPVPPSDQPLFTNGVALVRGDMSPETLMAEMLEIEAGFGRQRLGRWEARVLDLDIIDFNGLVLPGKAGWRAAANREIAEQATELVLPHPRMHQRRFVLQPLAEILPGWIHPVLGRSVEQLLDSTE
ncbi:MAG: 2-amino-4-hydroxy-6-hydroxymethyldihydropteridine diphosphokinase [Proteobacteria bacterium]|nr:2-amino-4-hydroxy-6-hydroxymethyldihydropteridine diphosphokinase [Pseudomonadota bacterium]